MSPSQPRSSMRDVRVLIADECERLHGLICLIDNTAIEDLIVMPEYGTPVRDEVGLALDPMIAATQAFDDVELWIELT